MQSHIASRNHQVDAKQVIQIKLRQDSKKLGKFLGKRNKETERELNKLAEQFTARYRRSPL